MADTCQYCKHFYVPPQPRYAGVNLSVPDEKWCIAHPQWVAKDYATVACGEFAKYEAEAK